MSPRKPKILLLLHEMTRNGASKVMLDGFRLLQEDYEVMIVSAKGGPLEPQFATLGATAVLTRDELDMPVAQRVRAALAARLQRARIGRRVKAFGPDMIYINTIAALPLVNFVRLPPAPVLLHIHELDSQLDIYVPQCAAPFRDLPNRYVADSEAVRRCLIERFGVPPEAVSVVFEFIADDSVRDVAPPGGQPSERPFVVGSAGNPHWRKGELLWLEMASELVTLMGEDRVRFRWVGVRDSVEGRIFRLVAGKMPISPLVELVPETDDPLGAFEGFDVFTVTSWEEPFSIVMAEAMMLGKPGLCFAGCGGTPEVIGDAGTVVPRFSARAMAEEIAALAADPDRMRAMGQASRRRVLENFLASHQVPRLKQEIDAVLQMRPRGG